MKAEAADRRLRHSQQSAFDARSWRQRQLGKAVPFYGSELFQLGCPPLASFIAAFLGCMMTLHLSASGLSPMIASAMTAMLLSASLILTRTAGLVPSAFFSSAYGGSFVGMTPVTLLSASVARSGLPLDLSFALLSLFCGLVFCLACALDLWLRGGLARGYGGRLGALAAVASFLFIVLAPLFGADRAQFPIARMGVFDQGPGSAALTFALCAGGMLVTLMALRWPPIAASRRSVRIFVAAAVAFLGLVLLQQTAPDEACYLDAYYAGCFVGMSSPLRLRGPLQTLAAAALLAALLILSCPILSALGGGLGLVAFVTVLFVDAAVGLLVEARQTPPPTLRAWARGLTAMLAMVGLLLPVVLLREWPVEQPTGSIARAEQPVAAPASPRAAASDVSSAPAAIAASDGLTSPDAAQPEPSNPDASLNPGVSSDTLRPEDHQHSLPQRLHAAPPPRRVIRLSVTAQLAAVRRNQMHLVPQPRPRAAARHEVRLPLQEWRPDPSTSAAP